MSYFHADGPCTNRETHTPMPLISNHSLSRNQSSQRFGISVLTLLLAALTSVAPLYAASARHLFKQGKTAEAKDDYIGAYEAYHQAHLQKPTDLRYKEASLRLSVAASAEYISRGRKLRDQGQYNEALTDFLRALDVSPSNEAADQEIRKTRDLINGVPAAQATPSDTSVSARQEQRELASISSPVELKPLSNEPITLHMVADTKVIYQTIGKIAGVNILFDPDYVSKRIPVDLNRVTLYDALRSVSFVSQTFWRPVSTDTIFVAQDTRQKRTDLAQQAVQTFYLTNIAKANDLNEILNAIRNLMDTTVKLQAVPSQNAIVMRGTPDQLLLAQNIIDDLDKAKSEVVIDVAVMEVSRDLLRNIGIQLPGTFGVSLQSSTAASTATNTNTNTGTGTTPTTPATGAPLSLNDLNNLNATNFAITLGSATANLLLTDADTRMLQNPEIRAVDGEKATLKIGSKIPIASGSFSSGIGGVAGAGISPLVSTQFTYVDVGVNMELQPTIHYDQDITLKMKVEISNVVNYVNLGGISQPVIGQRTLEQTIRMQDGQPTLLGGILQHTETLTVGGTPGLGEIPLLKYLFSSRQKETVNDEIVFLLIPHVVRGSDLTLQNLRTIDTGSGTTVQLNRIPVSEALAELQKQTPPAPKAAVPAAMLMNQAANQLQQNAQSAMQVPGQIHTGQPAAASANTNATPAVASAGMPLQLTLEPAIGTQQVGSRFPLVIHLENAKDLFDVPMELHYDPRLLTLVNVDTGDLLSKDGQTLALAHRDDGNGNVTISISRPPGIKGVDGSGSICALTFQAKAPGDATVSIVKAAAHNSSAHILPVLGSSAVVHVQ